LGFSLVEMMVGIVLGLLTVLLVSQVFANAEAQKRTTTSGSDAQLNGALALYSLQRDVQMAGYGLAANPAALGCTVKGQFGATVLAPMTLAPVVIVQGASDAPDTITLLSSSKTNFSLPMYVSENHTTTTEYFVVRSSLGTAVGDILVAIPETWDATNWCSLVSVTSDSVSPTTTLSATYVPHATAGGTAWNQSGTTVFPVAGYPAASTLVNLGQVSLRRYSVSSSEALQVTTLSSTDGTLSSQDVYPQIVTMKALYGRDTNGDGVVDTYNTTASTTAAGWQQVLSIRVAVVARSGQREKDIVTTANPVWDVGNTGTGALSTTTCGSSRCMTLKVGDPASVTNTEWKYYRYKVYDTVIPLRNVLWNS
jgi:type IV pilus assembly protein PilW